MIVLNNSSSLKLVLGAAPSAEAQYYVSYSNSMDNSLGLTTGVSDGTTDVTMLNLPSYNLVHPQTISVYNAASGTIDVTIKINDTILIKQSVSAGGTLLYSHKVWSVV